MPPEEWPADFGLVLQGFGDDEDKIDARLGVFYARYRNLAGSEYESAVVKDVDALLYDAGWDDQALSCRDSEALRPIVRKSLVGTFDGVSTQIPVACVIHRAYEDVWWVETREERHHPFMNSRGGLQPIRDFAVQTYALELMPGAPHGWVIRLWIPAATPACQG